MENSFNSLKAIGSITFASLSLLAMPFLTISAEAGEDDHKSSVHPTNIVETIDMIDEDVAYIDTIREHYHLD
jgi:hypothetical protein